MTLKSHKELTEGVRIRYTGYCVEEWATRLFPPSDLPEWLPVVPPFLGRK